MDDVSRKITSRISLQMLARFRAYKDHPDPPARVANTVALVVASNQPFYPLYLHAIVGPSAWPAWITLVTMPLFAGIPALTRRHSLVGRAMLPIVGVVNGILATKLIGFDTGVELFLLPCVLLATLLFRATERVVMGAVLAWPFLAYFVLDKAIGAPIQEFTADAYRSIIAMHAFSVASLLALIGLLCAPPALNADGKS
jgi:hypothetical protein